MRKPSPQSPLKILVLLGKGNNAGDALIALTALHHLQIPFRAHAVAVFDREDLKPQSLSALEACKGSGAPFEWTNWRGDASALQSTAWDVCLDGIFGLSFRPPMPEPAAGLLAAVNAHPSIRLRASIDYPSGLCETTAQDPHAPIFQTDFTYQTGSPKRANLYHPGRLRYADIGFFKNDTFPKKSPRLALTSEILHSLTALRPPNCDKRTFGHCFVLSGSRTMAGAHLMNVQAALTSGAGLVTALCPPAMQAAFCAQAPAAMWAAHLENDACGASSDGADAILEKLLRATTLLMGSGMGRSADTQQLILRLVAEAPCPLVLDADALTPETLTALARRPKDAPPCILTPHAGEYARLNPADTHGDLDAFCRAFHVVTILKGPRTHISDGQQTIVVANGSPALARGGSGDVLAGLVAGLLAQTPNQPFESAVQAAAWHAAASEIAERQHTQRCATTQTLLQSLPFALS